MWKDLVLRIGLELGLGGCKIEKLALVTSCPRQLPDQSHPDSSFKSVSVFRHTHLLSIPPLICL